VPPSEYSTFTELLWFLLKYMIMLWPWFLIFCPQNESVHLCRLAKLWYSYMAKTLGVQTTWW